MSIEQELAAVLSQIPAAIEKAVLDVLVLRHPGHGSQKVHGNRYGGYSATKESLRRLKDDKGARERYKASARGKAKKQELKSRPKLIQGLSYGEDIDLSGLKVGQTIYVPFNERTGSISGTIAKIKSKNIDYEISYMGKPMTLTTSKENLRGGYAAAGKKVHKIR